MSLPIVAIIGRPNVGKSTLFNRIIGRRLAVVEPTPGVTRDRNTAPATWNDREFLLIDTGGLVPQSDEQMQQQIAVQSELAIEAADVVLLLVDGRAGVHPDEHVIASLLRKSERPLIVAANKLDSIELDSLRHDFAELGLDEAMPVSAMGGGGVGDLLDQLVHALPDTDLADEDTSEIRLAFVGRPNVGKSSLVNQLVGETGRSSHRYRARPAIPPIHCCPMAVLDTG